MWKVASLILAAFLIAMPARAGPFPWPQCSSAAIWDAEFHKAAAHVRGSEVITLNHEETLNYLLTYNAIPPTTNVVADYLIILTGPPRPVLIAVVVGTVACVWPVNQEWHDRAMATVRGQPT